MEELLEYESDWLDREDESSQSWINEGVKLYEYLSRANRNELRYRETLLNLLLLQGEDLKLQHHAYKKAKRSFQTIIEIDPEHSKAYYRLGFLYFYENEWVKAMDAFQQALKTSSRSVRKGLDSKQQLNAQYYILKLAQIVLNETLNIVEEMPPEDLESFGEMKFLLDELKMMRGKVDKPYLMIVNGVEYKEITEREYWKLSDPFENEECFILNIRSFKDGSISFNEKEHTISPKEMALLEIFMRNPEGVDREDLTRMLYRYNPNPNRSLRQLITRLRNRLTQLSPIVQCIETIDHGYRWNSPFEYRLFKHKNISLDLYLD